tara:strand:+ start:2415 stop:2744 length:330 start_codon:yes stop_codon:yes gene_type:complete
MSRTILMIACIIIISSSSIPQLSTSTLILPSDDVSIEIISPIDLSTITQETIKKNQSPSIIDKSLTIKFNNGNDLSRFLYIACWLLFVSGIIMTISGTIGSILEIIHGE